VSDSPLEIPHRQQTDSTIIFKSCGLFLIVNSSLTRRNHKLFILFFF